MPVGTQEQLRALVNQIVAAKQAGVAITPTAQQIAEAERIAQSGETKRTVEQIIADYKAGKK